MVSCDRFSSIFNQRTRFSEFCDSPLPPADRLPEYYQYCWYHIERPRCQVKTWNFFFLPQFLAGNTKAGGQAWKVDIIPHTLPTRHCRMHLVYVCMSYITSYVIYIIHKSNTYRIQIVYIYTTYIYYTYIIFIIWYVIHVIHVRQTWLYVIWDVIYVIHVR